MRLKWLKLVLRIGGALLLAVGGCVQGSEVFGALHTLSSDNSATLTMMMPMTWLYVAVVGFVLLIASFFVPKRREHEKDA
jgi:heme/copper-type cytochrome/quinol oxidase subunit 2